ncbi:MAG: lysophospholipase L1-like esterase [Bacteroidia bacterium]|jgi:lysophospholipase L1-like esterase
MNVKNSTLILSIAFTAVAFFLCPVTRPVFGFDMTSATDAALIYYWLGAVLFMLLALIEIPKLSEVLKKAVRYGIGTVLVFGCLELTSAVTYRILFGNWAYSIVKNQNQYLFEEHPQLVGALIKNASHTRGDLTYSHNSKGFRSDEFTAAKPKDKIRIMTLGGSTTYGVGVNNGGTWPSHLAQELGDDYEIINMAVPGYSSRENLLQSEMYLSELQPDLAIYYIGLNDLRNINIENLADDYSDFHQPSLYGAFGLCKNENLPALASLKLTVLLGQKLNLIETCPNQEVDIKTREHQGVDERALSIYKSNLERIISLCKSNRIEVMFVPQTLLEEVLITGDYSWWIPYVPTEEMDNMMDTYNMVLKEVADSGGVSFASSVFEHNWQKEDFVDLSHFTDGANKELAKIIANEIRNDSTRVER